MLCLLDSTEKRIKICTEKCAAIAIKINKTFLTCSTTT